jgi:hypothetical protein
MLGLLSSSLEASLSSATSAHDPTLAVESPSSGFSSPLNTIGKYSAVGGIYQNKQGLDNMKQNMSDASISMDRKKLKGYLRWLVSKEYGSWRASRGIESSWLK